MSLPTLFTLETLTDHLAAHITRKTRGQVRDLQVESRDQQIILRGRSRTYHIKQIAHEAALDESGDYRLINEIEVC